MELTNLLKESGKLFEEQFTTGKIKYYDTEELYFMIDYFVAFSIENDISKNKDLLRLKELLISAAKLKCKECRCKPEHSEVTVENLPEWHPYYELYSSVGKKIIVWEPSDDRPEYTGNLPSMYPVNLYLALKENKDFFGYLVHPDLDKDIMDQIGKETTGPSRMQSF